jgi:hypothetical protein
MQSVDDIYRSDDLAGEYGASMKQANSALENLTAWRARRRDALSAPYLKPQDTGLSAS